MWKTHTFVTIKVMNEEKNKAIFFKGLSRAQLVLRTMGQAERPLLGAKGPRTELEVGQVRKGLQRRHKE